MSDFQTQHSVQAVGPATITYIHTAINDGDPITFQGFKLQSQFLDADSVVSDFRMLIQIFGHRCERVRAEYIIVR